ncbi:MAG: hypothetical protein LBO77_03120 [Desulfovibrio sp.]|jgi:hypothetical protein|nr:hypothetical protein [Desulfovibrio sp.]
MRIIPGLLLLCFGFFCGAPNGLAGELAPAPQTPLLSRIGHLPSPGESGRALPSQPDNPAPAVRRQDRLLRDLWNRYAPSSPRAAQSRDSAAAAPEKPCPAPGRCLGDSAETRAAAALSPWAWRQYGYELYFASAAELARSIYGLALATGDVGAQMTLERFERGAQGFHYGVLQLCPWAENLLTGKTVPFTMEERRLLDWLLLDGVLAGRWGKVVPGGEIRHVLGAARGKKRSLDANLAHERLHVLWDEDKSFREAGLSRWQALSEEDKQAIRASLPGYSRENEDQFVEEWTVREAEKLPAERRKRLIGL